MVWVSWHRKWVNVSFSTGYSQICSCVYVKTYTSECACVSTAPTFDYGDMPSPLSETESTITVLLRPAQGRGAPVRSGNQICLLLLFILYKTWLIKGVHRFIQYIPGGGWRGDRKKSKEGAGTSGLFPASLVPRRSPGPGRATLLHSRAAAQQPARGQSLHSGWQSHVQRLLEQPSGSTQKLPCLLPSYEQLQRGEWL